MMNTRNAVLLLALTACAPSKYRLGVRAANEGRDYDASMLWIEALDDDIYQKKPRAKLAEHGQPAFDQLWSEAQEHEASGRYAEAAATFEKMFAFAEDLESVEQLGFPTDEARAQWDASIKKWGRSEFEAGAAAEEASKFADAIGHFQRARELDPTIENLDGRESFTWLLWAEDDLARHEYASASEHYRKHFDQTEDRRSRSWAAAIDVALGRHALKGGHCRHAVEYFERAGDVLGDVKLAQDTEKANDCARIGLLVEPVTEEVDFKRGDAALGSMLVDRMEQEIDRESSRFVKLLATDALDGADNPPERRVRVSGRITQAAVEPATTTQTTVAVKGEAAFPCDKETSLYDPDAVCTGEADVRYTQHRTASVVRMAGSVKIVELETGERNTRPLDITLTYDSTHASDFQIFDEGEWVAVQVGVEAGEGKVAVPAAVLALLRAPEPLPAEAELVADAIEVMAETAGLAVIERVDREEPPPKPTRLPVRPPTEGAGDLDFATPAPDPEAPKMVVEPLAPPEPPPWDKRWSPPWKAEERTAMGVELRQTLDGQDAPEDVPTLRKLTELALWETPGEFESWAERVETFSPDDPQVTVLRMALRTRMGLFDQAHERFTAWIDAHPDDALAWKYYGLSLAEQKKPEARRALENALKLGLNDAWVRHTLEMIYSLEESP